MATSIQVLAAVGGAAAAVASAWVGTGVYTGTRAEKELQALAQASGPGAVRLSQLKHERGLLSSKGMVQVNLQPGCAAAAQGTAPLAVQVEYELSHLPLPQGMVRASWKASPLGEAATAWQTLFGAQGSLQGESHASASGAWRTEMQLPAIALQQAGESVQITPSRGSFSLDGKTLAFRWNVDKATVRGQGQAFEAKDLSVDVDLANRHLGTGTVGFRVASLSAGFGSLEGLELRTQAAESGDRLNVSFTPSVKSITAQGRTLRELVMEMALEGLDSRSVETLSTAFESTCGFSAMTAQESSRVQEAATVLLSKGFALGINRLAAKADEGAIDGKLRVELAAAAKAGTVALASQLKSSGQLSVSAKLLNDMQRQMALGSGFATAEGEQLRAGFEYAGGLLKVNGKAMDAGGIQQALAMADQQLHGALEGLAAARVARAPVQAPEAAPALAAMPAESAPAEAPAGAAPATTPVSAIAVVPTEAPAPAADGSCRQLADCMAATLAAARTEDVDTVRRLAGVMEALPKPDLGNKTVARKLNNDALATLRGGDAVASLPQFRQALKENPRDVEVAGNLGFALVRAGQAREAVEVLRDALVLDPRRSSTWTPLAEALALAGRGAEAQAALWVAYQWSGNREKSLAYYADRATNETQPALASLYRNMSAWALGGNKPALLASR